MRAEHEAEERVERAGKEEPRLGADVVANERHHRDGDLVVRKLPDVGVARDRAVEIAAMEQRIGDVRGSR